MPAAATFIAQDPKSLVRFRVLDPVDMAQSPSSYRSCMKQGLDVEDKLQRLPEVDEWPTALGRPPQYIAKDPNVSQLRPGDVVASRAGDEWRIWAWRFPFDPTQSRDSVWFGHLIARANPAEDL